MRVVREASPEELGKMDGGLSIGRRLRELRKAKRITLDALAQETGFTKGYLSKLENGHKVPPIASLAKICGALGTDFTRLLQEPSPPASLAAEAPRVSVVRSHERQTAVRGGSTFGYDYQTLAHKLPTKLMEPFIFSFPSHVLKEVQFEHPGEEMILILSGTVEFEVAAERYVLMPGDCIYFDASLPHRGRALNGEAKALVVVCGADANHSREHG
jgi:transcriptional regulator with XRE-family HTH domain